MDVRCFPIEVDLDHILPILLTHGYSNDNPNVNNEDEIGGIQTIAVVTTMMMMIDTDTTECSEDNNIYNGRFREGLIISIISTTNNSIHNNGDNNNNLSDDNNPRGQPDDNGDNDNNDNSRLSITGDIRHDLDKDNLGGDRCNKTLGEVS